MTEYTPNYLIPYPEAGDPIWSGYQQIEVLARRVDEVLTEEYGGNWPPETPEPEPDPHPVQPWQTTGMRLRDNGTINLGVGGGFRYRWRIDRSLFQCYFDIRWGAKPSSGGGRIRITLPSGIAGPSMLESTGSAYYWSAGGNFGRVLTPTVVRSASEMTFLAAVNDTSNNMQAFQIWNGSNGSGTGVPNNPGFTLDANGSAIFGNLTIPIM